MAENFENPNTKLKSACFSVALVFAVFSLLPVSRSFSGETLKEERKLTKVNLNSLNVAGVSKSESFSKSGSFSAPNPNFSISLPKFSPESFLDSDYFVGEVPEVGSGKFSPEKLEYDEWEIRFDDLPRRLSGGVAKYPPKLLRRGLEGEVKLLVEIDENGSVKVIDVLSSSGDLFTASARKAAETSKYEPPTKNGVPTKARFVLPVPFRIERL